MTESAESAQLAHRVTDELQRAGLHVHSVEPQDHGGFGLQVIDEGEPSEPSVHVVWSPSGDMMADVYEHMINRGERTHPSILHAGHIKHAMAQAILEILTSAGLDARMSTDDLQPLTVEVFPTRADAPGGGSD